MIPLDGGESVDLSTWANRNGHNDVMNLLNNIENETPNENSKDDEEREGGDGQEDKNDIIEAALEVERTDGDGDPEVSRYGHDSTKILFLFRTYNFLTY